jgi:hypothetical protein
MRRNGITFFGEPALDAAGLRVYQFRWHALSSNFNVDIAHSRRADLILVYSSGATGITIIFALWVPPDCRPRRTTSRPECFRRAMIGEQTFEGRREAPKTRRTSSPAPTPPLNSTAMTLFL